MSEPRLSTSLIRLGAGLALAVTGSVAGTDCSSNDDIHETAEAKGKPCIGCHQAAYASAKNPLHVDVMPQTCGDCHQTKAWVPVSELKEHPWFPLQNKHAGQVCSACHTKGYRPGDTAKDCKACHQKDFDSAQHPVHTGISSDCTMCHDDRGFRPSKFVHPWPLVGKHAPRQCTDCHTGSPPRWAGLGKGCVDCHQKGYDTSPYPGHQTFPVTCLDCHQPQVLSWKPALEGLHPEASFPLQGASKHAGASCMDCHQLSLGASKGGANTDCISCHTGSHQRPAIDQVHATKGVLGYPTGPQPPSFCRTCHPLGVK